MKIFCCQTCLLIISLFFWFDGYTQSDSPKMDSLKKVLLTEKEDTNKVNTLLELGKYYFNEFDVENSSVYTNLALHLSQKLNFKKGEGYA